MKTPLGNDYCGFRADKIEKLEPVLDGTKTIGFVRPTVDGAGAYLAFDAKRYMVGGAIGVVLMRHWPPEGPTSTRHDLSLGIGGFLARAGWTPDDIHHFVDAICRETGGEEWAHSHARTAKVAAEAFGNGGEARGFPWLKEEFGEAVAKTVAKLVGYRGRDAVEPPASIDGLPTIKVAGGELSATADAAEDALVSAGIQFFERSNMLVRPIVKEGDTFHGRKTTVAQLARVEQPYMRDVLCRKANWVRLDTRARKWVAIDPPHDVASTVLARSGEWKFSSLAGIITTQTMRHDGTILYQPGYDPITRLLLVDPPPMVPIPENPTREEALASLAKLEDLLGEFELANDIARAVALSAFITPVVRGAFPVAPMHIADAPVAGSGKSYLFDTTSAIAIGQLMPVIAAGRTEEETEKRLGAALLTGQPLITIDNVNGELRGDALCQIIERSRPQVRILGKSELIEVETRGTTLFANGNNITIVGDLCRRVVRIRLNPKMERPELRVFTGNPVATVLADRGTYVAAALTICRAYVAADRPNPRPKLASFEGWSDTVRSALVWLGKADPVDSMEMVRDEDPEKVALGTLLTVWGDTFGTGYAHRVPLKDVIAKATATRTVTMTPPTVTFENPELNAAVRAATTSNRTPDVNSLGYFMRSNKERIVNGMWFDRKNDTNEGTRWWVQRSDGASVDPGM